MQTFTEELEVAENYDGWRLDKFLTQQIKRATRSQVQRYIRGRISIRPERRVKASMRVRTGDVVIIRRTERILPLTPPPDAVDVLYREERLAIVNKPPGILVHRTSREVTHTLDAYLKQVFPDVEHAEATHRLDRDTSGCVICALSRDAVGELRERFQHRKIDKRYLAVIDDPTERWRTGETESIDIPIGPDPDSEMGLTMGRGDLSARTDVHCFDRTATRALVLLKLHDGRQHQIRVHLSLEGTPIVGDKLYGPGGEDYFMRWYDEPTRVMKDEPLATPFHCLHAWTVGLDSAHGPLRAFAPLPHHMRALMNEEGLTPPDASDAVAIQGIT